MEHVDIPHQKISGLENIDVEQHARVLRNDDPHPNDKRIILLRAWHGIHSGISRLNNERLWEFLQHQYHLGALLKNFVIHAQKSNSEMHFLFEPLTQEGASLDANFVHFLRHAADQNNILQSMEKEQRIAAARELLLDSQGLYYLDGLAGSIADLHANERTRPLVMAGRPSEQPGVDYHMEDEMVSLLQRHTPQQIANAKREVLQQALCTIQNNRALDDRQRHQFVANQAKRLKKHGILIAAYGGSHIGVRPSKDRKPIEDYLEKEYAVTILEPHHYSSSESVNFNFDRMTLDQIFEAHKRLWGVFQPQ